MKARPEDAGADALPDPARSVTPRHPGAPWGGLALALVIALQIAVPTVALLLPPPQRFGFQMYSGLGGVTLSVVDSDGVETTFDDTDQLVGKFRPEIDWLPSLPEAVCYAIPHAVRVHAVQADRERTVECD
ncbi:hypothetical protein [Agromyces sp. NPDC049794]|uniref:hypothetical protein n=1 Tax=unclassified Agromyces TaxID=2639701 RepID=UPI0033F5C015